MARPSDIDLHISSLVNEPVGNLNNHQKEEMIYYLKMENRKKDERFNKLITFLKNKYSYEQDEQLFEEIGKFDSQIKQKLHLAFLFASPLGTYCFREANEKVFT